MNAEPSLVMLARTRGGNLPRAWYPTGSASAAVRPEVQAQAHPREACSAGWWHSPSTPSTTSEEMASSPLYAPAMRQSEARRSSPLGLPREWRCSRITARWLKIASRQPAAASLAVRYVSASEHESDLKPTASVHD